MNCDNCGNPGAGHAAGGQFFCDGPCAHEHQGWPDCQTSHTPTGHDKLPPEELCQFHRRMYHSEKKPDAMR
jgi:hypothetical protein